MVGSDVADTPYVYWTNWCGAYKGAVTVAIDGGAFADPKPVYISNPPRCDNPTKPSTVRLAHR